MNYKSLIFIIYLLVTFPIVFGQNVFVDSLKNKTFKELKEAFFDNEENHKISKIYANAFLQKSKLEKDTFRIAQGYKYITYISPDTLALKYVDSIIFTTKNFKNNSVYPAFGYYLKGAWLFNLGKEKKALENYLISNEFAIKSKNIQIQMDIKQAIANIRMYWGEHKEALNIYEEYYEIIKSEPNYKEVYKDDYLILLHNLSNCYLKNEDYNKSIEIVNEGLIESKRIKDSIWLNQFIFNLAVAQYYQEDYNQSFKNLVQSSSTLENSSLAINYYYRGKILETHHKKEAAIKYFWKVDSLYNISKESFSELREVYTSLLNHSRELNNHDDEYKLINKLLYVDSILDFNEQNLNKDIKINYDIPLLKKERDVLKNKLSSQKKKSYVIRFSLILLVLVTGIFSFFFYKKQRLYKKRFDKIIAQTNSKLKNPIDSKYIRLKPNEINISEDIIKQILDKLEVFESSKAYIKTGLTLNKVSKEFETNSSYLSKIINHYKQESFSNYLNSLRIAHSINELRRNRTFRNYTIVAIAEEVGFNNSESFSKAFYKKVGIYPSFFIKKLKKENVED